MAAATKSRPVLLLGSVPLGSAAEVFEAAGATLGGLARRIPDGETGPQRLNWVGCQAEPFRNAVGLEPANTRLVPGVEHAPFTLYAIKPGTGTDGVKFGPLGYARWAIESYKDFMRLRSTGNIQKETRMQVSMPTPFAVAFSFSAQTSFPALWRIYERRMFEEIDEMARAIPHRDLAIQWDIAPDMIEFDTVSERPEAMRKLFASGATRDEIAAGIARAADSVPADVEMGLHFCYGDPGHKHLVEPKHTGPAVELANRLVTMINRPITWVHLPVPRGRADRDYFAPLAGLKLEPGTELYLGLVHFTDGLDGAKRRIAAANSVTSDFGIATECGMGRRKPETIRDLLRLHREIATL
jgi:methionine synthase II (cobalamin-independent)